MAENQNDVVLKPNEYAYVLDDTKGQISCLVGPYKTSLSTSDSLVRLNEKTKRFEKVPLGQAVMTFVTAPENWYVALKNPVKGGEYPKEGMSNALPDLQIGKKVNIPGNISFALFPGQMAKVIKGHTLRSNQYLLVRVYDAVVYNNKTYKVGQLLIIKGTDVSFYIPPTGFEVVPDDYGEYVRDAVTLESLEYCILKSEEGEKKYIHGPAIVFPEPNETFIMNDHSYKFRALELSDISGVYVKVITAYDEGGDEVVGYEDVVEEQEDEEGNVVEVVTGQQEVYSDIIHHYVGEELFFTGKDMMIYYPRPEHAIIGYDGNVLHHAIAIPAGEGRYVLNRMTGDIKMVTGPLMYLPDPRYEVIVKRKLTRKQCDLWYPGNKEVLRYNESADEITEEELRACAYDCMNQNAMLDFFAPGGFNVQTDDDVNVQPDFNRKNTYTKPRTITIDNKFDGVVTIDVWAGYAVSVLSKNGNRRVVTGPKTVLLAYDEVLEEVDGEVYLKLENKEYEDYFTVKTKDLASFEISTTYRGSFEPSKRDKWFNIREFVDYLFNSERNAIRKEVCKYSAKDFFDNYEDIISSAVITGKKVDAFPNGFTVNSVNVDFTESNSYYQQLASYYDTVMRKRIDLAKEEESAAISAKLAELKRQQSETEFELNKITIELNKQTQLMQVNKTIEIDAAKNKGELARVELEKTKELADSEVAQIVLQRRKDDFAQDYDERRSIAELQAQEQETKVKAFAEAMQSISPDLVAAISSASSSETLKAVAESLAPWALASGQESVTDVVNKLTKGTSLEGLIDKITKA